MKTVHKFEFPIEDRFEVEMPEGAQILSVATKFEVPCIWALVDTEAPLVARCFRLAGTGHDLDDRDCENPVGTFQMNGGHLVWHLFDLGEIGEAGDDWSES